MISKITNTMPIVENPLCVNESSSFTWVIIYQDGSAYQCRSLPGRFTWPQICSFTNHYFGHWHDFLIHLLFATEIDPKMFHIGPPHHGKQSLPFVWMVWQFPNLRLPLTMVLVFPFHDMKNKIKCKHENIKISK